MFGVTTLATFAASATVATVMTGDAANPMIAEDIKAIASSVGLTGALTSIPIFMATAIANKLADRAENPTKTLCSELAERLRSASEGRDLEKHIQATARLTNNNLGTSEGLHAIPENTLKPEFEQQSRYKEDQPGMG